MTRQLATDRDGPPRLSATRHRPDASLRAATDVRIETRIDELARLRAELRPSRPARAHSTAVRRGLDRVRAIRRHDRPSVVQLQKRRQRRHELFDGRRETRQAVGRRQIVGDARPCGRGDRQRESDVTLPHEPDARLAGSSPKEFEGATGGSVGRSAHVRAELAAHRPTAGRARSRACPRTPSSAAIRDRGGCRRSCRVPRRRSTASACRP